MTRATRFSAAAGAIAAQDMIAAANTTPHQNLVMRFPRCIPQHPPIIRACTISPEASCPGARPSTPIAVQTLWRLARVRAVTGMMRWRREARRGLLSRRGGQRSRNPQIRLELGDLLAQ